MPSNEPTLAPPGPEDRDGFMIRANYSHFSILKNGKVWAEPDDGEAHYVAKEDYPQDIRDELTRRIMPATTAKRAQQWHALAETHILRIRLGSRLSAKEVFTEYCEPVIRKAIEIGQTSICVRLVMRQGNIGPPRQAATNEFIALLKEFGCGVETASWLVESGLTASEPQIHYVPLTISW